jgi:hypothetical protein
LGIRQNFAEASGTLVFENGETEQTILIDILFNLASEEDKEFTLVLSSFVNAAAAQPVILRVVIEDAPVGAPELDIAAAVAIKWVSLPGIRYRVMWSNDLEAETWMVLENEIDGFDGEVIVFDEIVLPKRFYRVEIIE